jgi:hypothetical protein
MNEGIDHESVIQKRCLQFFLTVSGIEDEDFIVFVFQSKCGKIYSNGFL